MKTANLKVRVYPAEKEALASLAESARISLSELVRRVLVGIRLPASQGYDMVKDIVKVNNDLARLGNLLRLALKDEKIDSDKVNDLIDDIRRDRFRLKDIMDTLNDGRKP